MFDYTMTALQKIKSDFQKIMFACSVLVQALYVAYLIAALFSGAGNAIVNGVLLFLCAPYLVFYLVMYFRESKGAKKTKKIIELVYRRSKQLIKFFSLAASIYAIVVTGANANHFTILITAFMLISFVLQILLEIVYKLVIDRLQLLVEGIKADVEPITKTVKMTGNLIKKIKGEEIEPEEEEKSKHREWLDQKVVDYRTKRAEEKAKKQLALKEMKAAKKQAEQEEKQRLALEKKQAKQQAKQQAKRTEKENKKK